MSEPSVESVQTVDLRVLLPACASGQTVDIALTRSATLDELRELLAIVHLSRNLSSYDVYIGKTNVLQQFDPQSTLESVFESTGVSNTASRVDLTIKPRAYTLQAVYDHLERFRELIGLQFLDGLAFAQGELRGSSRLGELGLAEIKTPEETGVSQTENKVAEAVKPESEKSESEKSELPEEAKSEDVVKTEDAESEETKDLAETADPPAPVKLSDEDKTAVLTVASELFVLPTLPGFSDFKNASNVVLSPLRSISVSGWSPVPTHRQTKGDLLYLVVQTLEGDTLQITAHVSGFYVNRCLAATFNPDPKVSETGKVQKHFILYDLVRQASPLFSRTITENERALGSFSSLAEAYLVPLTAFGAAPWAISSANLKPQPDASRTQLPLIENGVDGSSNCRDWNDDVQALRELPSSSIEERLVRDQLLAKALFEFTAAATATAINVIKGNVPALNPQDPTENRLYLRNGIFYFMNVNDLGAFDELGGAEAARYTSLKDLAAVRVLNRVDAPGIATLVCCVVDYRGQRVVCQAPVPGIFQGEDNKVAYGASVARDAIGEDEQFAEALKPVAERLHLKAHPVILDKDIKSEGSLLVSKDSKGIRGSDGRQYLIDLYHSTPLDIEFAEKHWDGTKTSYPHKETVMRHEAVEEWWKRKVSVLIKAETDRLDRENGKTESDDGDKPTEKPRVVLPADLVVVNPDAFANVGETDDEKDEVRELSRFITQQLVPEFLSEIATQISPFDGAHLARSLHNVGINMRYLGHVVEAAEKMIVEHKATVENSISRNLAAAEAARAEAKAKAEADAAKADDKVDEKTEEKPEETNEAEEEGTSSDAKFELAVANLTSLTRIAVQEMISRAAKHVMRRAMKDLPEHLASAYVAHFHNCLLALEISANPAATVDAELAELSSPQELEFTKLTASQVQDEVANEVYIRFRHRLADNWVENMSKTQVLREIALKFGIQWKALDYVFTQAEFEAARLKQVTAPTQADKKRSKKKLASVALQPVRDVVFVADDVIGFVPIIKDSTHRSSLTEELYEVARVHLYKGDTETGLTLLGQLLGFCEQVYGRVHPETARFYAAVAQVYSEVGLRMEACVFARRACVLLERISGIDSYETILAYINAAFFENQNRDPLASFTLYKQVLRSWNIVYGLKNQHPSTVNTVANLADLLTELELYEPAVKVYNHVLEVSENLNGNQSAVTGMIHYRFARSLFAALNIKGALEEFRIAHSVFEASLGPQDVFTKETAELIEKFESHIKYTALMEAETKKQQKQAQSQASVKKSEKPKKGKKQGPVQSDPEIAQRSVEEILQFIEGKGSKKGKK